MDSYLEAIQTSVLFFPLIALLFTTIGVAVSITALMLYVVLMMINSAVVAITINEFVASKISVIDKIWKKLLMVVMQRFTGERTLPQIVCT